MSLSRLSVCCGSDGRVGLVTHAVAVYADLGAFRGGLELAVPNSADPSSPTSPGPPYLCVGPSSWPMHEKAATGGRIYLFIYFLFFPSPLLLHQNQDPIIQIQIQNQQQLPSTHHRWRWRCTYIYYNNRRNRMRRTTYLYTYWPVLAFS